MSPQKGHEGRCSCRPEGSAWLGEQDWLPSQSNPVLFGREPATAVQTGTLFFIFFFLKIFLNHVNFNQIWITITLFLYYLAENLQQ